MHPNDQRIHMRLAHCVTSLFVLYLGSTTSTYITYFANKVCLFPNYFNCLPLELNLTD